MSNDMEQQVANAIGERLRVKHGLHSVKGPLVELNEVAPIVAAALQPVLVMLHGEALVGSGSEEYADTQVADATAKFLAALKGDA